jgi:hypothetical protein
MIYVITHEYSLTRFLFTGLDGVEAILTPIKHWSFIERCFKYMLLEVGFPVGYLGLSKEQVRKIKEMKSGDALIYLGESPTACLALSKICNKKVRKICFFWNSCITVNNCEECIERIRKSGFSIATFDSVDAQRYNLISANQFYRKIKGCDCDGPTDLENDFFFCGKDKGRKELLQEMQTLLSSFGTCKFIIPGNTGVIPYPRYIEEVKKSRVLCDVTQKNQSGLTLRVLESIFFSKKLITNNPFIEGYDFFNPNNILIYTSRTAGNDIQSFLMKPYEPVDDEILARYEVANVLKKL